MRLRGLLLGLFFLSGATALVYQVLWLRLLTLVLGTTTSAVGTVLTSFMVGLAVGALFFGRLADRAPRPLRLYAILELGIALSALALPRALDWLGPLYPRLYATAELRPWVLPAVRALYSSLLLLVPCTLIGGTLPVLVRFAARVPHRFGRHFGWLYGMNTLGAMVGSLVGGLWLLGRFGVSYTNTLAAATNAFLAVAFLALDRYLVRESVPPAEVVEEAVATFSQREKLVVVVAALSGCTILGLEVLWTRALVHALLSTTYTFCIIVATVLLALALGSFFAARWAVAPEADMGRPLLGRIAVVEIAFSGSLLLTMPLLGQLVYLHLFYAVQAGPTGLLAAKFLTAAALLLVPATIGGMLFPLSIQVLSHRMSRMGRSLGRVYLLNTLASAGGALLFSFVLIPSMGVARSYQGVIVVHVALAAVLGYYRFRRAAWLVAPAALMVAAVLTLRAVDRPDLLGDDIFARPEMEMRLLAHRETADATFAVYEDKTSGRRLLYINGFLAATDSRLARYMPMMAHLPLLLHPEPHRVLVIAFGAGGTAGAASLHPIDELHIVDVSEEVYRLAPYFSLTNHDVLSDPRTKAIVEDGRNYIQATADTYDVITSEPMPPKFSGMVSFYTREYYEAARSRLTTEGVICQWLPFHLVSLEDARMVSRTFVEVFPHASLWVVQGTGLLIGGNAPLRLSADVLTRGFENPAIRESLGRLDFHSPEAILGTLKLGAKGLRILAGSSPVLTDDQPFLEFSGDHAMFAGDTGLAFRAIEKAREQLRSN